MRSVAFAVFVVLGAWDAFADVYSELQGVYDSNPIIGQGRADVDMAAAVARSATTDIQPYLGLAGNIGVARTDIGDYSFDYAPMQYGVELQQNIFQGGAMFAKIKAAKGEYAAANAKLYATQQQVFLDAINAYIEVLNARAVLTLNQNNHRVLKQYYDFVKDGQDVGRLTQTDVAQAAARLEMAQYHVIDATAQYDNACETYRRIFGDVPHDLVDIDVGPMASFFPVSIDVAEEYALRHHPALIALGIQEDAVRQNITVAYSSWLPSIDVRGAIQQINNVPYLDDITDSRIGVYLKVPLYDKGNALANSDKVRANIAGIQEQTINARRVIIENLRMAWNVYLAQEYAINATRASMDANRMALDGIRDEQARGRRTVLDVLNAEQEILNSQVAHTRAKHARISAYFAVVSAVGELTPENLGLVVDE